MKKLSCLLLALMSMVGVLAFDTPVASADDQVAASTRYVGSSHHDYVIVMRHVGVNGTNNNYPWGYYTVEAYRYQKGTNFGTYLGMEINTWMPDYACPTLEYNGSQWLVAYRATLVWQGRDFCQGGFSWEAKSLGNPTPVTELDVPNTQYYGYHWNGSSYQFIASGGSMAYGPWAPMDRTSYSDPHSILL